MSKNYEYKITQTGTQRGQKKINRQHRTKSVNLLYCDIVNTTHYIKPFWTTHNERSHTSHNRALHSGCSRVTGMSPQELHRPAAHSARSHISHSFVLPEMLVAVFTVRDSHISHVAVCTQPSSRPHFLQGLTNVCQNAAPQRLDRHHHSG
jgi:hypothetical protein